MTRSRILIAGTQSGVGKTTVTVGLIAALRRRGLGVQPFKVGPDYIDPTYHTLAADRPCRNLDAWMLPAEAVHSLFTRALGNCDIAVIEGVMGVFDGCDYEDETGSSAHIAKLLSTPVLLIVDASKMARSAAALAAGFAQFDPALPVAGFIVNRVGSEGHGRGVAGAITNATGLPVFGCLPRSEALQVPERHLGLVPTLETGRWQEFIAAAGEIVENRIDIDQLLEIARAAPALPEPAETPSTVVDGSIRPVIAVARDAAFHFTYEDNLDMLRAAGAEVVFFSPLADAGLPDATAGVILSGGFPEVHAERLAANVGMLAALRAAHAASMPIYAECGGLMYLTEAIVDPAGQRYAMVGLLPGHSVMSGRLTLGYRRASAASPSWLFAAGETVRGHEFHYSQWQDRPAELTPAFVLRSPRSGEERSDGACVGNLWASYLHLHFAALPELVRRFVVVSRDAQRSAAAPLTVPRSAARRG